MAGPRQQPARFLSIPDLLASSDPSQEGLLRVIGRLEGYDIEHSILCLQDHTTPSLQVAVDSSNIEPFHFKRGSLYQFIGEVNYRDVPMIIGITTDDWREVPLDTGDDKVDAPIATDTTETTNYGDVPISDEVTTISNVEMDTAAVAIANQTTRCVVMKALLYRCVNGLNMDVYLKAHEARMKMIWSEWWFPLSSEHNKNSVNESSSLLQPVYIAAM